MTKSEFEQALSQVNARQKFNRTNYQEAFESGANWAYQFTERYQKALDLALYYVAGDATYEGVKAKIELILKGGDCICGEINARNCPVHQTL